MRRMDIRPRQDWQQIVASQGLLYHTADDGEPYWNESACYALRRDEIDRIERASYALNEMCLAAVQRVLDEDQLGEFGIASMFHGWLRRSWETEERTIYGRFDLAYRDGEEPRLLEYNADTPTSLLEAAVAQWFWLQDTRRGRDQFNSLHERLIEAWQALGLQGSIVHFASPDDSVEDSLTVNYLRDTAVQAGLTTEYLAMLSIGWDTEKLCFVDLSGRPIETIFKLYPWEWMLGEAFGPRLPTCRTRWLEAPWKMLLSNKLILKTLWEMYPESPYLLPADTEPALAGDYCVRKPCLGREGANVALIEQGRVVYETEGEYQGPVIYQQYSPLAQFDGKFAVLGSWMVNGYACGLGIREDSGPVTGNGSQFVPHFIE
jgi:glutathionylspermidine synthase